MIFLLWLDFPWNECRCSALSLNVLNKADGFRLHSLAMAYAENCTLLFHAAEMAKYALIRPASAHFYSCHSGGIEIMASDQHPGIKPREGNFAFLRWLKVIAYSSKVDIQLVSPLSFMCSYLGLELHNVIPTSPSSDWLKAACCHGDPCAAMAGPEAQRRSSVSVGPNSGPLMFQHSCLHLWSPPCFSWQVSLVFWCRAPVCFFMLMSSLYPSLHCIIKHIIERIWHLLCIHIQTSKQTWHNPRTYVG